MRYWLAFIVIAAEQPEFCVAKSGAITLQGTATGLGGGFRFSSLFSIQPVKASVVNAQRKIFRIKLWLLTLTLMMIPVILTNV